MNEPKATKMMTVFTIGYEGTDIERFIATLKATGVTIVADVRAVALSRKKGFSKTALRARLADAGIAYMHFIELGDPKPGREAARAGHYDEFRSIYARHLSENQSQIALASLEKTAEEATTCLLCFERDPSVCHRSIVAERLQLNGMNVFNLYGDDPERYVRNAAKLPSRDSREGLAAA
jgi:uncharacterized protein (DUF488 family)